MKILLYMYIMVFTCSSFAASTVSESSLQLNAFEKKNHSIAVQYKKISMGDAAMYRGSADSDAHITYATDAVSDIELNGIEFSYGYRWRSTSMWKSETTVNFLTSLDEPELSDLERQYYTFEMYAQYMNVNVSQRFGREFVVGDGIIYLYGSLGLGFSVLKLTENWKQLEGNTGDSADLKSYARHLTFHYELGGCYRINAEWAITSSLRYDVFKVDKLHTDFYGYSSGSKITGENDTDIDQDKRGNFSSLSYGISFAYFF